MIERRFAISEAPLEGLRVVMRQRREDDRGFLSRLYCREDFGEIGLSAPISQINHSLTRMHGTVRGMHFQHPPDAEEKLVTCIRGEAWDVAVDLRKGSPTFLSWHAERLSAENGISLLIPKGFAHGFQALTDNCELLYLHTAAYAPRSEGAVNALDPKLGIDWPLPVGAMSERDRSHPFIDADFAGIEA